MFVICIIGFQDPLNLPEIRNYTASRNEADDEEVKVYKSCRTIGSHAGSGWNLEIQLGKVFLFDVEISRFNMRIPGRV